MIMGKIFVLSQNEVKSSEKTLEQRFLKEFKATCKNAGDSELKQHKHSEMHHRFLTPPAFELFLICSFNLATVELPSTKLIFLLPLFV